MRSSDNSSYARRCVTRSRPPRGEHVVSEEGLDNLVAAFAIDSTGGENDHEHREYGIEVLALSSAIEVICSLPCRLKLIEKYGKDLDHHVIAEDLAT